MSSWHWTESPARESVSCHAAPDRPQGHCAQQSCWYFNPFSFKWPSLASPGPAAHAPFCWTFPRQLKMRCLWPTSWFDGWLVAGPCSGSTLLVRTYCTSHSRSACISSINRSKRTGTMAARCTTGARAALPVLRRQAAKMVAVTAGVVLSTGALAFSPLLSSAGAAAMCARHPCNPPLAVLLHVNHTILVQRTR